MVSQRRHRCRILHLPKGVIPLTTVVIGHPAEQPPLTDRLPLDAVVHYDRYKDYTDAEIDELWAEKEASPETAALLVENGLPNLAQIFTRNRYRREDNKDNWWNRFKRKIGEKPVVYDPALTLKSAENLKAYMESHGFFSSRVRYHVDTTSRRKRAIITYRTEQGPPSRYGKINYEFNDKFIEKIILQDTASTLIRPGGIFNSATLDAERERITRYLRDRGYYNFSVNNISYRYPYDTVGSRVGDLTMVVKQYLTGYNDRGEPVMENNKVYRISEINMLPGYDPTVSFTDREVRYDTVAYRGLNVVYDGKHNVRPRVLRQAIPLYPNYLYNAEQINRTYNNIMSLGYFKSTRITFDELPAPDSTNLVSYIGNADDSLATQYTQEGYLRCNILGTASRRGWLSRVSCCPSFRAVTGRRS